MNYRPLGDSELHVSSICLGTMTYGQQNTEAEAHSQLDYAFEHGINFVDTAEMYPVPPCAETYSKTETIVGNWLKNQPRDKVILATKAAGPRRSLTWIRGGPAAFDRANLRLAIEGSLIRLRTDYIDLYQLHWPERNVPIFGQYQFDPAQEKTDTSLHDQLQALAELVQEGKIRYVGVSNETAWGVMEFLRIARDHRLPRIVSIQNCYNLLNRGFEFNLAEIVYREKLALLAYSPLAFGHLSAKYLADPKSPGRATEFPALVQRYGKPGVVPAVAEYAAIAGKYGYTPAELALAFVYHRWFVASTIIGATTLTQLRENISAWEKPLASEILAEIEAVHLTRMNPAP